MDKHPQLLPGSPWPFQLLIDAIYQNVFTIRIFPSLPFSKLPGPNFEGSIIGWNLIAQCWYRVHTTIF